MTSQVAIEARCFISYHRPDNEVYGGVVDRLASDLSGRFAAETGRDLKVFIDRNDIPGGADWRKNIADAIAGATIFIPVVTMRYFNSDACREELIAFHDGARELGVTDLIIPVILAGAGGITVDDPRPEVRIIERLNYRPIGSAVDAGFESSDWRVAVRTLVEDIAKGLTTAESAIEREESGGQGEIFELSVESEVHAGGDEVDPLGEEYDLLDIQAEIEKLTPCSEAVGEALTELGDVVTNFGPELDAIPAHDANRRRAVLLRIASEIRPSSARLGVAGAELEAGVRLVDRRLRGTLLTLDGISGEMSEVLKGSLTGVLSTFDTGDSVSQMDGMAQTLSAVGVMNVSLRKALEPALRGVRATKNAVSIASAWRALGQEYSN